MFSPRMLLTTLAIFIALPFSSSAQEQKPDKNTADASDILFSLEKAEESLQPASGTLFTASAELGLLYLTGNTRSADIKTGLDLRFERDLWRSFFIFDLLVKKNRTRY